MIETTLHALRHRQLDNILVYLICYIYKTYKKEKIWDLTDGCPVVKKLPYYAVELGSLSGQETNISHAIEELSPCVATTEPVNHNQGVHAPQQKMLYDEIKISHVANKT